MNDLDLLRRLDPAVTGEIDTHDPRHLAVLERAMSSAADASAGRARASRSRRTTRRLVFVGTTAAAAVVAGAALPGLLGDATGALAWSASPAAVSSAEAAELTAACTGSLNDSIAELNDPAVVPVGKLTALVESRGVSGDLPTILVHLQDGTHNASCYFRDGDEVASSGAVGTTAAARVVTPRDGVRANLGAAVGGADGTLREVNGTVGSDVVGVTLKTVASGEVIATVRDGYFVAWWPDSATGDDLEDGLAEPEIDGAILTLADGTTRSVAVDQMVER